MDELPRMITRTRMRPSDRAERSVSIGASEAIGDTDGQARKNDGYLCSDNHPWQNILSSFALTPVEQSAYLKTPANLADFRQIDRARRPFADAPLLCNPICNPSYSQLARSHDHPRKSADIRFGPRPHLMIVIRLWNDCPSTMSWYT